MTLKTLNVSLIAAGVLAVGTAGAIGLKPDLIKTADTAAVTTSAAAATTAAGGLAPAAPVPARSAVPDYRAIVAQAGPAVVGNRVYVTDFGLALQVGAPEREEDTLSEEARQLLPPERRMLEAGDLARRPDLEFAVMDVRGRVLRFERCVLDLDRWELRRDDEPGGAADAQEGALGGE